MLHVLSNRLIDLLPPNYRGSFLARLEAVSLPVATVLYRPVETPRYAHFMTSGVTSIVTFMADGNGVEVGLVGCEGIVEWMHLLGSATVMTNGFMQVEGTALRIGFGELMEEFHRSETLRGMLLGSVQRQTMTLAQIAACNRLHEVDQRLARWLLMVRDRVGADRFALTQEFLAEMLGVQRTTVTAAASVLQRKGLIEYRRGHLHLLDVDRLKAAACECYGIVRGLFNAPARVAGWWHAPGKQVS